MDLQQKNTELNRMRSYSSVFSSTLFTQLIRTGDFTFIDTKIKRYDTNQILSGKIVTYLDYIRFIYHELSKQYRNEYFYKNTFISSLLLEKYGLKDTILLNEFRVGRSIADLVMINGTSRAFEIKTELDSKKRLRGQIADYSKVFSECFIITDESLVEKYAKEEDSVGILALQKVSRSFQMKEVRVARRNEYVNPDIVMGCLRTNEYKNIVKSYYGVLPEMNSFNMFNICLELIRDIPQNELSELFHSEIKNRKTITNSLGFVDMELRQLVLALNLNKKKYQHLITQLSSPINF